MQISVARKFTSRNCTNFRSMTFYLSQVEIKLKQTDFSHISLTFLSFFFFLQREKCDKRIQFMRVNYGSDVFIIQSHN